MPPINFDPFRGIGEPYIGQGTVSSTGKASELLDFGFVRSNLTKPKLNGPSKQKKPIAKQAVAYSDPTKNACKRGETKRTQVQTPWEKALYILVNDFLDNRSELLRLNPGRRRDIEGYLFQLGRFDRLVPLESIVCANTGSKEGSAFLRFAWETSIFHLFQFLLLKRWVDQGRIPTESFGEAAQRVNWLISQFAKSRNTAQFLGRQNWNFLRINRYSWFKTSQKTWRRLIEVFHEHPLNDEAPDYLNKILLSLREGDELDHLNSVRPPAYSYSAWEILAQKNTLAQSPSLLGAINAGTAESTLVCGLLHGQALQSMATVQGKEFLNATTAMVFSNFEKYLAELQILWNTSRDEIPTVNIIDEGELKSNVRKDSINSAILFSADVIDNEKEANLTGELASCLRENGSLLCVSNTFWTTDQSEAADIWREEVLGKLAVCAVIDLRFLQSPEPKYELPKCLFLLEKNSSKEYRDSVRPIVIKAIGKAENVSILEQVWHSILDGIRDPKAAAEVHSHKYGEGFQQVKVEIMSAATLQGQLSRTPWTSLAEPAFYEISSVLKRHPYRAGQQGVILKPQNSVHMSQSLQRAVQFVEIPGKALFAHANGRAINEAEYNFSGFEHVSQHVFLPDIAAAESSQFFAAVINSSPIQFWYRLEWEQLYGIDAKRTRSRVAAQMLKLLPVAKLFEPGAVAPCERREGVVIDDLDVYETKLLRLCNSPKWCSEDAILLQKLVIDLEENTQYHLSIARDYMHYLYPGQKIHRWEIPHSLPEIDAEQALSVLSHLPQASVRQHPSIQIVPVKNVADFKLTSCKFTRGNGGYSELLLYNGSDLMTRVHGPSLLVRAIKSGAEKRFGRPWSEVSSQISFPIDVALMTKQLKDFVQLTQSSLSAATRSSQISDFAFMRLFSLKSSAPNEGDALIIRNHLAPATAILSSTSYNEFEAPRLNVITTDFAESIGH